MSMFALYVPSEDIQWGVQREVDITSSATLDLDFAGAMHCLNTLGTTITFTLPVAPRGTWCDVMQTSPGTALFAAGAGATLRQTDVHIENRYERMRVQMGANNEWNIEGTLKAAPTAFPSGGVQYVRVEDALTTGTAVDQLIDQIGAASYSQTGTPRPLIGSGLGPSGIDAITFNGSDQWLPRVALASSQTQQFFTCLVIFIPSAVNTGAILDDTPAGTQYRHNLNFGNLRGYNGGSGSWDNLSYTSDSWLVVTTVNNGLNTKTKINAASYTNIGLGGEGGGNAVTGVAIGAASDGASLFTNMRLTDMVIGSGDDTVADGWHSYLRTLRGI